MVLRSDGATHVSLWIERWQRHIPSWLHLSLSRQLLRLFRPRQAAEDIFSWRITLGSIFIVAFPNTCNSNKFYRLGIVFAANVVEASELGRRGSRLLNETF